MGKSLSFSELSETDNNGLGVEHERTGIGDGAIFFGWSDWKDRVAISRDGGLWGGKKGLEVMLIVGRIRFETPFRYTGEDVE